MYRLCFKIVLTNYRPVTQQIEYNAGIKHKFSITESQIAVPEKLLKVKDLRETYTHLSKAKDLIAKVGEENGKIKEEETSTFEGQKEKMERFKWMNILEIAVICLLGGYQYLRLKKMIETK